MIYQALTSGGYYSWGARCDRCGKVARLGCTDIEGMVDILQEAGWEVKTLNKQQDLYEVKCPKCRREEASHDGGSN